MSMRIRRWEAYQVATPFRVKFKHAKSARRHSASIITKCELEDGTTGFGESLPREYVTGETWEGCFADLAHRVFPALLSCDFGDYEEAEQFCAELYQYLRTKIAGLPHYIGATCCAVELALLDAYGRHFERTAFAAPEENSPRYSGVISGGGTLKTLAMAWQCRRHALPSVKLKVGPKGAAYAARLARAVLGPDVSLRVDANMSWTMEQALAIIPLLQRQGIEYVEQPLATGKYDDLRRLQEATGAAIVADEDLRDEVDALALIRHKSCRVFNIRLSKCGGFFNALRLGQLAMENGLQVQIGCQVGETALLSAAGLAAAGRLAPVIFAEGCFGSRLLREDILDSARGSGEFQFGEGGQAPVYTPRNGLDIAVDEEWLARYSRARAVVEQTNGINRTTRNE